VVSNRAASWLAWSLAALSVAMFLASVALWILARSAQLPNAMRASVTLIDMLISVPVLASYGIYGLARSGSVPYPVAVYALGEWLWVPAVGLLAILHAYILSKRNKSQSMAGAISKLHVSAALG
jgi:hypothetical protein